MTKEESEKLTR